MPSLAQPFAPPLFLSYGNGGQGQLGWRPDNEALASDAPTEVLIPDVTCDVTRKERGINGR